MELLDDASKSVVCRFLCPFELVSLRRSCRCWHAAASEPVLWQRLAIRLWARWDMPSTSKLLATNPQQAFNRRVLTDVAVVEQAKQMCLHNFKDWFTQEKANEAMIVIGPDAIEPLLRMAAKCSFVGVTEGLLWQAPPEMRIHSTLDREIENNGITELVIKAGKLSPLEDAFFLTPSVSERGKEMNVPRLVEHASKVGRKYRIHGLVSEQGIPKYEILCSVINNN